MHAERSAPLFAALFALILPVAASAAEHTVTLSGGSFSPSELNIAAGDTVTFRNQSGAVHNAQSDPGAPNSFRCANGCDGAGGSGQPSAANWTASVTLTAAGITRYYCAVHGGPGGEGMSGTIIVTGTVAADPPAPVDDLVRLRVGDGPVDIDVLANDFDLDFSGGGSLAIVSAPAQGSAVVVAAGTATPADDRVRYTLPTGVAVDTTLRYRVCNGGECADADVRILARGFDENALSVEASADAGFVDVAIAGLPALPEARFEATSLAWPDRADRVVAADATPASPWDAGSNMQSQAYTLPASGDGSPRAWGIVADTRADGDVDLYAGVDLDGDSLPDEGETRCTSAMSVTGSERCELQLTHPGTGTSSYWVAVHNPTESAVPVRLLTTQVPLEPGDGSLVLSGPGHLVAGETSVVRLGWDDPRWGQVDVATARFGFARVRPTPASDLGWVPVRLDRLSGEPVARALVSGRDLTIGMFMGWTHRRVYIDVPPGATSLTVSSTAAHGGHELHLSHRGAVTSPAIEPAPPLEEAVASDTGLEATKVITLVPPTLVPGRWYVIPRYLEMMEGDITLRATVAATAPTVRSGSYFNPARGGHGLFVYPAGAAWTVLWYHYFEDGSPTWYYLEGAAPSANGVFTSGIYRSAWDGDSNHLQRVGEATLTPSGPDAFTWSWTLDGRSGAEPLASLGRGCPTVDGGERDASSTWFDIATAGTGYSVQLFPNETAPGYEYNAAFVYDGQGRPRYLAAELASAGPSVHTYDLEQLTGFCPLCPRLAAPSRAVVGTFTRTYAGGTLTRVEVDAIYGGGIPGAWTGDDDVNPLGGPSSTQGCDF